MAVAPLDLDGIAADLVHPLRLHVGLHLALAHHPLAAPLLDALRARTARAQPARRELRLLAVVPAHQQRALVVEGQVAGLGLRRLRLDLVEQAHADVVARSAMQRSVFRSSAIFQLTALPYDLLASAPVWERHCARMALELPPGARHVLDLGCGPGNSTLHLGPGAIGGD